MQSTTTHTHQHACTHTLKLKDKLTRVSVDTDYISYILKLTHILQLYQSISVERVNGFQKN